MIASLDHLTVAALTLKQGVAHVRRCLGVDVPAGGSHLLMGTHNCLMQLGDGVFLEVIAPDPTASPQRTRWFSLDHPRMRERLAQRPRLISWVARVPDLGQALRALFVDAGTAVPVTRGSLSFLISVPNDGSMPFGGAFPTLIEWPAGAQPTARMADLGCRLEQLAIEHPDSGSLNAALAPIFDDGRVTLSTGAAVRLQAVILTPTGRRELT